MTVGHIGVGGLAAAKSHSQILAAAIQLVLIGAVVLMAMWIAHLLFFFGPGSLAAIGLAVVAQNIISSQFNSSLFDYTHGWGYVLGVGVLSGQPRDVGRIIRNPKPINKRASFASLSIKIIVAIGWLLACSIGRTS